MNDRAAHGPKREAKLEGGRNNKWGAFLLKTSLIVFGGLGLVFNTLTCAATDGEDARPRRESLSGPREPIKPLPQTIVFDKRKAELGRQLFHEADLSRDGSESCASCHDFAKGGADGRPHSLGVGNAEGMVNAPTVYNSGLNFKQFWDGRANTLEEQVNGPVENPAEMGSQWSEVLKKLRGSPRYSADFGRIYPDGVQVKNIQNAIAEFERSLVTPDSRFDQFLRGDQMAITPPELEGYRKFKTYGCASCHQGVNVGGNMFETLGAVADYFGDRGRLTQADYGRFNVTGKAEDKFVFRVPSLRNVALTAPYFHDGSAGTLKQAVQVMAKYQLGRELSELDVEQIVAFLGTLTGKYEGRPL